MMVYNANNARGAVVFALDPIQRIDRVTRIDTSSGVVYQAADPLRLDEHGEVVEAERKFAAVWPVFSGRSVYPVLFHCYGERP